MVYSQRQRQSCCRRGEARIQTGISEPSKPARVSASQREFEQAELIRRAGQRQNFNA